jgi:hypothetical protein
MKSTKWIDRRATSHARGRCSPFKTEKNSHACARCHTFGAEGQTDSILKQMIEGAFVEQAFPPSQNSCIRESGQRGRRTATWRPAHAVCAAPSAASRQLPHKRWLLGRPQPAST